jgi:hypothetical protein
MQAASAETSAEGEQKQDRKPKRQSKGRSKREQETRGVELPAVVPLFIGIVVALGCTMALW